MKFLCLGYGNEAGWNALGETGQEEVLAQDEMIRQRGNLMSAVTTQVTCVRNWNRHLEVVDGPYAQHQLPLAGFSVIEADNLDEVIDLVADTPCARASGVIEIYPFWDFDSDNDQGAG